MGYDQAQLSQTADPSSSRGSLTSVPHPDSDQSRLQHMATKNHGIRRPCGKLPCKGILNQRGSQADLMGHAWLPLGLGPQNVGHGAGGGPSFCEAWQEHPTMYGSPDRRNGRGVGDTAADALDASLARARQLLLEGSQADVFASRQPVSPTANKAIPAPDLSLEPSMLLRAPCKLVDAHDAETNDALVIAPTLPDYLASPDQAVWGASDANDVFRWDLHAHRLAQLGIETPAPDPEGVDNILARVAQAQMLEGSISSRHMAPTPGSPIHPEPSPSRCQNLLHADFALAEAAPAARSHVLGLQSSTEVHWRARKGSEASGTLREPDGEVESLDAIMTRLRSLDTHQLENSRLGTPGKCDEPAQGESLEAIMTRLSSFHCHQPGQEGWATMGSSSEAASRGESFDAIMARLGSFETDQPELGGVQLEETAAQDESVEAIMARLGLLCAGSSAADDQPQHSTAAGEATLGMAAADLHFEDPAQPLHSMAPASASLADGNFPSAPCASEPFSQQPTDDQGTTEAAYPWQREPSSSTQLQEQPEDGNASSSPAGCLNVTVSSSVEERSPCWSRQAVPPNSELSHQGPPAAMDSPAHASTSPEPACCGSEAGPHARQEAPVSQHSISASLESILQQVGQFLVAASPAGPSAPPSCLSAEEDPGNEPMPVPIRAHEDQGCGGLEAGAHSGGVGRQQGTEEAEAGTDVVGSDACQSREDREANTHRASMEEAD